MRLITLTVVSLFLTAANNGATYEYSGATGPEQWPTLFPSCWGTRQSPINIDTKMVRYRKSLKPITLNEGMTGGSYTLENVGHTVKVVLPDKYTITFEQETVQFCFKPLQMHWHWGNVDSVGSEHQINGKPYPIELHIVTYDCRLYNASDSPASKVNGLAVFGVFYEVDDNAPVDPVLTTVTTQLAQKSFKQCPSSCANPTQASIPQFNLTDALPSNTKDFYRYMGSLTTPPCTENVLWTVFREPKKITTSQLKAFRNLLFPPANGANKKMVNNFRPVQPLNPQSPVSTIRFVSASFRASASKLQSSKASAPVTISLSLLVFSFLGAIVFKS